MLGLLKVIFKALFAALSSRRDLVLENLALRQQLAVLRRKYRRPRIGIVDKVFWLVVRGVWYDWRRVLFIVEPDTVVRWHRAAFGLYWKWISRKRARRGRRPTTKELRELIFKMVV
jgi:hypothetical protein